MVTKTDTDKVQVRNYGGGLRSIHLTLVIDEMVSDGRFKYLAHFIEQELLAVGSGFTPSAALQDLLNVTQKSDCLPKLEDYFLGGVKWAEL